jgi:hypothetical protein
MTVANVSQEWQKALQKPALTVDRQSEASDGPGVSEPLCWDFWDTFLSPLEGNGRCPVRPGATATGGMA